MQNEKAKKCFKCHKTRPLSGFYKNNRMADGHVNKCKECTKADVRANRDAHIDYYRRKDRERGNRQTSDYLKKHRAMHPNQYKAQGIVNNSIRAKKLFKESCEVCGAKDTHAHHDDYLKPLNIRWLCAAHHSQWHKANGEGKNR